MTRRLSAHYHPLGAAGLLLALLFWAASQRLHSAAMTERDAWPVVESWTLLPPPSQARLWSLGYNEFYADITWVRTIWYYTDVPSDRFDFGYLEKFLDNVLAADPHFRRVYQWAAYQVTLKNENATQQEYLTSLKYLELGMKQFPETYLFPWEAGLRYFLDLDGENATERRKHQMKGASLIEKAMHKPDAPARIITLAASLRSRLGQHQRALETLREALLTTDDPDQRQLIQNKFLVLSQNSDLTGEIASAAEKFRTRWVNTMPYVPPDFFVLLGETESPDIKFDKLATERDLFGSDIELP